MVKSVLAEILFGRDFSSVIFWSGFFFKPFSVGMSLQKISGVEHVSSEKKRWRMSLQRFCLVEISLLIFLGGIFLQTFFRRDVSSKKLW